MRYFSLSTYRNSSFNKEARGVLVNLSTLCLSSTIGRWIDQSSLRLWPLQVTIFLQPTSIFFACISWALIVTYTLPSKDKGSNKLDYKPATYNIDGKKLSVVIVVIIVGVVESLCAVRNNIGIERDWVRAPKQSCLILFTIELKFYRSLPYRVRVRIRHSMF